MSIPAGPGVALRAALRKGAQSPRLVALIATLGLATDVPDEGSGPVRLGR
jgi:hypothetical protein